MKSAQCTWIGCFWYKNSVRRKMKYETGKEYCLQTCTQMQNYREKITHKSLLLIQSFCCERKNVFVGNGIAKGKRYKLIRIDLRPARNLPDNHNIPCKIKLRMKQKKNEYAKPHGCRLIWCVFWSTCAKHSLPLPPSPVSQSKCIWFSTFTLLFTGIQEHHIICTPAQPVMNCTYGRRGTQTFKEFIFTYPLRCVSCFSLPLYLFLFLSVYLAHGSDALHANNVFVSLWEPKYSSELMEPPKMWWRKKRKQICSKHMTCFYTRAF